MKKTTQLIFAISVASTFTLLSNTATAAALDCAAKKAEIETQLSYAKQYGNSYRIHGLERALAKNTQYCNDAELRQKHAKKVAEKQQKVTERENDLARAKQQGDAKKIEKQQRKLQKAIAELNEVKA